MPDLIRHPVTALDSAPAPERPPAWIAGQARNDSLDVRSDSQDAAATVAQCVVRSASTARLASSIAISSSFLLPHLGLPQ